MALVRFGSVTLRASNGSSLSGSCSVRTVPLGMGFLCVSVQCQRIPQFRFLENGSDGSGSAFNFCKMASD